MVGSGSAKISLMFWAGHGVYDGVNNGVEVPGWKGVSVTDARVLVVVGVASRLGVIEKVEVGSVSPVSVREGVQVDDAIRVGV